MKSKISQNIQNERIGLHHFPTSCEEIPGQDRVTLNYIIIENDLPDPTMNADFLDDYVMNSLLTGEEFTIDRAKVHTFIVSVLHITMRQNW